MTLKCHYWGQEAFVLNLGDALVPLILDFLGFQCSSDEVNQTTLNEGRTLLMIGSLLDDMDLDRINGPIDVWGCGWRGQPLADRHMSRLKFHAVRGPLTARGLSLQPDIPLGDPGFLMPSIIKPPTSRHGRRLVLPHCLRLETQSIHNRLRLTGADQVFSPWVIRGTGRMNRHRLRQALSRLLSAGVLPMGVKETVHTIAGAGFVLTGSLHGAILSHAYGTPWAAYDDGGLDTPAKWQDLASLLGTDIAMVRDIQAGEAWWDAMGQRAARVNMNPLLNAFPYRQPGVPC